jgi:hypothetical protein
VEEVTFCRVKMGEQNSNCKGLQSEDARKSLRTKRSMNVMMREGMTVNECKSKPRSPKSTDHKECLIAYRLFFMHTERVWEKQTITGREHT